MGELERSLTQREFLEWMSFAKIYPFGPRHDDHRIAVLATLVANMFRDGGSEPVKPGDLMPWLKADQQREVVPAASAAEVSSNVLKHFFPPHRAVNAASINPLKAK